jgi:hypothetical protein
MLGSHSCHPNLLNNTYPLQISYGFALQESTKKAQMDVSTAQLDNIVTAPDIHARRVMMEQGPSITIKNVMAVL